MTKIVQTIVLIVALLAFLGTQPSASYQGKRRFPSRSLPAVDSQAGKKVQADYGTYALTLRTLDGTTKTLSDFAGRVVLVNLWAPWCAPCRVETPGFGELYDKFHKSGFDILGVAVQTNESDVRSFMEQYGTRWPVGLSDDLAREWGSYGLPDSYLFGWNGTLIKHFIGLVKKEVLAPYLEDALKQRADALKP